MIRRVIKRIRKPLLVLTAPIWFSVQVFVRKWKLFWVRQSKNIKDKVPLRIGHRGAMGHEPENTLASFKKALDFNVDGIEMDVYCCRTGEVIAIHDKTLERTTNGKGHVTKKDFAYLRALNAGRGEKIPTLEEVLDLVDKKVMVNIELKGPRTAEPVARVIRKYINDKGWGAHMFWVSSFDHEELKRFKAIEPEVKIGALIKRLPRNHEDFIKRIGADSINILLRAVKRKFIDYAHRKGVKVFVWTVNHPDDIKRMKLLGVDAIISNFPDRI